MTNTADMGALDYDKASIGIERALAEIIPRKETDLQKIETQLEAIRRQVDALIKRILRLLANRK
jgi:hypothetical protein